jgi:hypothetical protein
MKDSNGNLTVGAIYDILKAGLYLDVNVDMSSAEKMRESLRILISTPERADPLWRAIYAFPRAALELKNANIGLGGKVQR